MVRYYIGLVSCAILFMSGETLKLPSNMILCHRNDHFDECLQNALQDALPKVKDGLPDFKIPPLDPLILPSLIVGGGNGPVNIVQSFKNINITGLSKGKVENVRISLKRRNFTFDFDTEVDHFQMKADYNMTGRILLIPVSGVGKCVLDFYNFTTRNEYSGVVEQRNGIEYIRVEEVKNKMRAGKINYYFDNFFDGNEELGKQINDVLNENWKDVFDDVREGYETTFALIYKTMTNNLFSKVPAEEIFLA